MSEPRNDSKITIDAAIKEVGQIVSEMSGIQLGSKQQPMVESRLKSRLIRLGISSFDEYLKYLRAHLKDESQALLSLITTHHTFFFREFSHFEFLLNKGLDRMIEAARKRPDKKIKVWSAASSRGQEVYSLAMFLNFHLSNQAGDVGFEIYGTDVDPESIKHAQNGVYRAEELKQSPAMYIKDNWVRGTGKVKEFAKAKDHLIKHCHFETVNLLSPDNFLKSKAFDIIFCRNIFIYFNQDQIKACTLKMTKHLEKCGLLFLGVSESINGLGIPLKSVGPSVFETQQSQTVSKFKPPPLKESSKPLEVLCVDDSPVILALLKKILNGDTGFVVKATAANGKEAIEKLKTQKFDVMTLDLHMPEIDGLGFLELTKNSSRPPVIIVSSINSDDTSIAQKALALGAADYVGKTIT